MVVPDVITYLRVFLMFPKCEVTLTLTFDHLSSSLSQSEPLYQFPHGISDVLRSKVWYGQTTWKKKCQAKVRKTMESR